MPVEAADRDASPAATTPVCAKWSRPQTSGCLTLSSCLSILDEHSDCKGCDAQTVRGCSSLLPPVGSVRGPLCCFWSVREGSGGVFRPSRSLARSALARSSRWKSSAGCSLCTRLRATLLWSQSSSPGRSSGSSCRGRARRTSPPQCPSPLRSGCPPPARPSAGKQHSTP